ncbi:hypothetical protein [Treponema succinifaciens]|uniref:Uncharacterized protein n=1 Tax=Treponema succinifaciens (strain ATCC 33096 / DSM 2489 / 6091) TaxID=869209 RepID=F2NXN7_TRES6|nr:hypothetical protein [Treponema succinifaciens]AEB15243.1 hypothetical protein Tresu_2380 [Treponema succinifaciens DSM 2489]
MTKKLSTRRPRNWGGVITFDELEPATYTVKAEAFDSDGIRIGSGSIEVKVVAGETAEKTILMILASNRDVINYQKYYLWNVYNSKYYYDEFNSITSDLTINNIDSVSSNKPGNSTILGFAESFYAYYIYYIENADSQFNRTNFIYYKGKGSGPYDIKFTSTSVKDPLYFDDSTDCLWIGGYDSSSGELKLLQITEPSTNFISTISSATSLYSTNFSVSRASYTAFAIQGSDIYIAYTNSGTSYLQRGTITGSNDSGFSITAKGTAQSTEQMGVAGTINDIAILYDGYVYVLISDIEKLTGHTINDGDTVKSRGAILKILGTDSGFEVEDILGWTNSARTISSKLNNDSNNLYNNTNAIYQINSIKAYIPKLSESSKKFYGAERFVAIKPKELAIADCGANIILPDYKNKKNGNMFQHDRVVTVNLYDFAITNVTELNNLDFKRLYISGNISSIDGFSSSYSSDEE